MVKKLLFVIVFLVSVNAFAQQDKKWSVEANYSIIPANGLGGDDGVIDLGVKYRFFETKAIKLGLGMNLAYLTKNTFFSQANSDDTIFIFQPKLFSEFNLPFSERLKPTLGLGYSFFSGATFSSKPNSGYNLNLGLIYDLSDKVFLQMNYDYIDLGSNSEGFNNIRLGVGFRF